MCLIYTILVHSESPLVRNIPFFPFAQFSLTFSCKYPVLLLQVMPKIFVTVESQQKREDYV